MARIILDFDPAQADAPQLTGDSSELIYFLSWAYSARYGASHELTAASLVLKGSGINLQPLLTFADRDAEDPADEDALDRAWQDAAPLAECCEAIVQALSNSGDPRLQTVQSKYPLLRNAIEELKRTAHWAAERGVRIRVTYALADDASS